MYIARAIKKSVSNMSDSKKMRIIVLEDGGRVDSAYCSINLF